MKASNLSNEKKIALREVTPTRYTPDDIEIYHLEEEYINYREVQSRMNIDKMTETYYQWLQSKGIDPYGNSLEAIRTGQIMITIVKKALVPAAGLACVGYLVTIFAAFVIKAVLLIGFFVVVYLIFYLKPEKTSDCYGDIGGGYKPGSSGNAGKSYTFNNCNFHNTKFK